jgi:hypothetical protein
MPPPSVYRQVSKASESAPINAVGGVGPDSNDLATLNSGNLGALHMSRQISKADSLGNTGEHLGLGPAIPLGNMSRAHQSDVPILGRQISKAGALNEQGNVDTRPGFVSAPPALGSDLSDLGPGPAPMPSGPGGFMARQVSKGFADDDSSYANLSSSFTLSSMSSGSDGSPSAVVFSPTTAPIGTSDTSSASVGVPSFGISIPGGHGHMFSRGQTPTTPTTIGALSGRSQGGLGIFRQDSISVPGESSASISAPLQPNEELLLSYAFNQLLNINVNVLMIGTGEYTTGYVHGQQSNSDKGAGVVALTLFDLQRRWVLARIYTSYTHTLNVAFYVCFYSSGKITGQLSLCGVNGKKFPGIRAHLKRCISDVYADMHPHVESVHTFPADSVVDGNAYKEAIGRLHPGDAVIIFTPDNSHFEIAKYAIERQLHVLVTKPLVQSLHDHIRLNDIANANNVIVCTEVHKRYDPMYVDARDKVRASCGLPSHMVSFMSQVSGVHSTYVVSRSHCNFSAEASASDV